MTPTRPRPSIRGEWSSWARSATFASRAGASSKCARVYLDKQGRHIDNFTETCKRDGPRSNLEGFRGFVEADAYTGYGELIRSGDVTDVACCAHVQRNFESAESSDRVQGGSAGFHRRASPG